MIEKAKVLTISEMINYAEGSIVSKELEHNSSGNITIFSFDIGQRLSEHSAPFDAFIQVVEGEMALNVEGVTYNIKKGECFIIPQGARHSVYAPQRFKMLLTMIKGE